MRLWSYGINSYHKTASYTLEQAPWYIYFFREANWFICSLIPRIPLPAIGKIVVDEEVYNCREWYGDFSTLWHLFICDKVFQWCIKQTKIIDIEYDYEKLKQNHPEDKAYFKEQENE